MTVTAGSQHHLRAAALALFVTVLWSSSWVLIRFGLDDEGLTPLVFAGIRYGLASILLVAVAASSRRERQRITHLTAGTWRTLVALGVSFYPITQGSMFIAIDRQPAATTSLVLSMTPLMVAVSSGITLGERPTARQLMGTVLVILGAVAYFAGDLGATAVGMAAAVVTLGGNTASSLLGRGVNRSAPVSALTVTAITMTIGSVVLLGVGLAVEGIPAVTARAWGFIVFLAVVNTALAFTLWNRSLETLSATESAAINNTMLIQIGLLGWWLLSEPLGVAEGLGIVLVTIGILGAQRRLR
jgi:drug/metabolite transporter (DMT)-like permease